MANLLRGEVYWADLNPVRGSEQSGIRPVLIFSNNHFNRRSGTVIAMAITIQPPRAPDSPPIGDTLATLRLTSGNGTGDASMLKPKTPLIRPRDMIMALMSLELYMVVSGLSRAY